MENLIQYNKIKRMDDKNRHIRKYLLQGRFECAFTGMATGIKLFFIYYAGWLIIGTISSAIFDGIRIEDIQLENVIDFISYIFAIGKINLLFLFIGTLIGSIPAGVLGATTGFVLCRLIIVFHTHLSEIKSMAFGLFVGLLVSILIFSYIEDKGFYWAVIIWPSFIYIGACSWISRRFYQELTSFFEDRGLTLE